MSGLFGSKQPAPVIVQAASTPPPVAPVSPIPDPNSPAVLQARRAAQNKLLGQAGRASTVLTTAASRGGNKSTIAGSGSAGTAYSNATLGGGA